MCNFQKWLNFLRRYLTTDQRESGKSCGFFSLPKVLDHEKVHDFINGRFTETGIFNHMNTFIRATRLIRVLLIIFWRQHPVKLISRHVAAWSFIPTPFNAKKVVLRKVGQFLQSACDNLHSSPSLVFSLIRVSPMSRAAVRSIISSLGFRISILVSCSYGAHAIFTDDNLLLQYQTKFDDISERVWWLKDH